MTAQVLVLAGYGLNCEEETLHAFEHEGATGRIAHINDVIDNPALFDEAQILAIPGGFSYGDDTGSGNAFAQKMRLSLFEHLKKFVERDTLTIGICNGCQILSNLGLVPAFDEGYARDVAVTYNASARYQCRWVDTEVLGQGPWLEGIKRIHIPVAHGEGRFMMRDETLKKLQDKNMIALQYINADGTAADGVFPANPNGSIADIAGITSPDGRVLAMMPHPERGMFTWQRDDYMELKDAAQRNGDTLPDTSDGMALFTNAVKYFG